MTGDGLPPRLSLAHLPTPIERLPRLSERLGVELFVKRDDLTGFLTSGNKVRKLEFLVAEALAEKCDTLVTCGALQSNHARATAVVSDPPRPRVVMLPSSSMPWKPAPSTLWPNRRRSPAATDAGR